MKFIYSLKILFFISFVLYFTLKDKYFWLCESDYGKLLIVLHHLVVPCILFSGLLFGLHYLNIIIIIAALLSWITLDACILGIMHNNACNFDKKTEFQYIGTELRKYIKNKTKIKVNDNDSKLEYIIVITILFYNIFMIFKKRRMQK